MKTHRIFGGVDLQAEQWLLIEDDAEQDSIWRELNRPIHFQPDYYSKDCPFTFLTSAEAYNMAGMLTRLEAHDANGEFQTTKQIEMIKSIFIACLGDDEFMYALDWRHSVFQYNPRINTAYGYYMMHKELKNTRAYFPEFYPDGDYYFFVAKDFSWGYLTHPWQEKVWVYGANLIELFRKHAVALGLAPCGSER